MSYIIIRHYAVWLVVSETFTMRANDSSIVVMLCAFTACLANDVTMNIITNIECFAIHVTLIRIICWKIWTLETANEIKKINL